MRGYPAAARGLALAGWLLLLATGLAQAQVPPDAVARATSAPRFNVDIPAQPLSDAVKALGLVTGLSVLAGSGTMQQRVSTAVRGTFTPQEALRRLLEGTDLQVRFPSDSSAVIHLPVAPVVTDDPPWTEAIPSIDLGHVDGVTGRGVDYRGYVALVQSRVTTALCQEPLVRPGAYRVALQLHIAASGAVKGMRQAGGTGDASRDRLLSRTLRALRFDPPPPGLPQPVTLLLRPEGAGVENPCAGVPEP